MKINFPSLLQNKSILDEQTEMCIEGDVNYGCHIYLHTLDCTRRYCNRGKRFVLDDQSLGSRI